jgi:hypothetical protein
MRTPVGSPATHHQPFKHGSAANDPNFRVINLDLVDDGADEGPLERRVSGEDIVAGATCACADAGQENEAGNNPWRNGTGLGHRSNSGSRLIVILSDSQVRWSCFLV